MGNINDQYFDGLYKDIWKTLIPESLSQKEVDFMETFFKLESSSKVLDLMCGYGRHSIELAKKGFAVTAVDNLSAYIAAIEQQASKFNLPIQAIQKSVLDFETHESFDLVICMGNSINFFSPEEISQIFEKLSQNVKAGGHLLINTWSLAEIAIPKFVDNSWALINEIKCLNRSSYLFHPTRIETETIMIDKSGTIENKTAVDYILSVSEMESLLTKSSFSLVEIYSIPGKKQFSLGDSRAYIVAKKI